MNSFSQEISDSLTLFLFPFRLCFTQSILPEWLRLARFPYLFHIIAWIVFNGTAFTIRLLFARKDLDQEMLNAMALPTYDEKIEAVSEKALSVLLPELFLSFVP